MRKINEKAATGLPPDARPLQKSRLSFCTIIMPETGLRDKPLSAEARLWLLVLSVARSGVALGYSGQSLWNGTLSFAHNMRGDLDLLTAHNVAIEAIRTAEREAQHDRKD